MRSWQPSSTRRRAPFRSSPTGFSRAAISSRRSVGSTSDRAPFILAGRANKLAALSLDHQFVAEVAKALGCTVLVGVRVGDAIVFVDHVGEESPSLTFVARAQTRRPLYTSAAGKTLLANVPDDEMYRLLELAGPEQVGAVGQFLAELPEIRSRRLAFNRGATFPDAFVVATPLLAPDGALIAAITAAVDHAQADRLDDLGEELKQAVATLGPKYWPQTRINGTRRRR